MQNVSCTARTHTHTRAHTYTRTNNHTFSAGRTRETLNYARVRLLSKYFGTSAERQSNLHRRFGVARDCCGVLRAWIGVFMACFWKLICFLLIHFLLPFRDLNIAKSCSIYFKHRTLLLSCTVDSKSQVSPKFQSYWLADGNFLLLTCMVFIDALDMGRHDTCKSIHKPKKNMLAKVESWRKQEGEDRLWEVAYLPRQSLHGGTLLN